MFVLNGRASTNRDWKQFEFLNGGSTLADRQGFGGRVTGSVIVRFAIHNGLISLELPRAGVADLLPYRPANSTGRSC
jgi:hypothetical protein